MPVYYERPAGASTTVIGGGNSGIPSHAASRASFSALRNLPTHNNSAPNLVQLHEARGASATAPIPKAKTRANRSDSAPLTTERPVAQTSGGIVSVTISLAEPVLYVQGFEQQEQTNHAPAMLRGSLILRVVKPTKIKAITLSFKGRARTEWPEGIPPRKVEFFEEKEILNRTWPFFHYQFATAEFGHLADFARLHRNSMSSNEKSSTKLPTGRSDSPAPITVAEKRLSLQAVQSRSFPKSDLSPGPTVAQKGYRVFQPGDYVYNFEHPVDNHYPETIQCELGSVKYELEAVVERAGAFRPNLIGRKDVHIVRCPAENSLESVEPIAISRSWEDQMYYEIVISGKSFPLGGVIPIAFKLTPLAKVRLHRVKIQVTENVEYFCKNKKVHRLEPTRKVQIFEKRADGTTLAPFPGSTVSITSGGVKRVNETVRTSKEATLDTSAPSESLLGDLETGLDVGTTEMEMNVRLPGCNAKEREKIHFDTTYPHIQVHHWIKIIMRLSKADSTDPTKRRHFEISIDSPFHILSCRSTNANTSLPAYENESHHSDPSGPCRCGNTLPTGPTSQVSQPDYISSIAGSSRDGGLHLPQFPPAAAAGPRPMHLIRYPSHNPPAFDDDVPPPPLVTPPPAYERLYQTINVNRNMDEIEDEFASDAPPQATTTEVLADYFSHQADLEDPDTEEDDSSEHEEPHEEDTIAMGFHGPRRRALSGLLPETPGRNARSLDERRTWTMHEN